MTVSNFTSTQDVTEGDSFSYTIDADTVTGYYSNITWDWQIVPDTATSNSDYQITPASGHLQTGQPPVTVAGTIIDDGIAEQNETFQLRSHRHAVLGADQINWNDDGTTVDDYYVTITFVIHDKTTPPPPPPPPPPSDQQLHHIRDLAALAGDAYFDVNDPRRDMPSGRCRNDRRGLLPSSLRGCPLDRNCLRLIGDKAP